MRPNRLRPFTPGAIHHFPYDIRGLRVGENCWNQISRRLSWCPAICSRICGTSRRSGSPATSLRLPLLQQAVFRTDWSFMPDHCHSPRVRPSGRGEAGQGMPRSVGQPGDPAVSITVRLNQRESYRWGDRGFAAQHTPSARK
ncbi:Uncharacterised protein [Mycobacteroides abscessus subsp. abscessus]|nr:Uncharacterised protein [Mycobacteroides abscessus subsp. abscessus]SKX61564.1 Uncharacterised protein [Mycobacteroides abscessus subsp. abscessus]